MLYSFEDFSLDTARRELRRSGTLISLQPQVFDLLEYLIRNRERVVSKDDLFVAVWNRRIVSESTLSTRINAARNAIGDSGEEQRLIRTAHGKGFRFVGIVREEAETVRRLAAIFAADVAGYSRLMEQDEVGTLRRLTACRAILDERIAAYRGRIFGSAGDSVVADFASAVDAVQCAVAVQEALAEVEQMRFRIGVHVGDVIVQGDNLFGDGVNIAARLEALAEPGGICISGTVRDQIGTKLPIAFADLGEQQVKNIAQPIRAYRVRATSGTSGAAIAAPSLPLPDKPSIAVLPFQNMSGDPEQEYFADGMVEEIITALSRIRWLFVIARNSSFTYKGHSVDVKQVGRELGVRYVLEGSVRRAGGRVRITAQLIEAITGAHLWADRFDGSVASIFELQDEVAVSVAGIIEPALQAAEIRRSAARPTTDFNAYDLYLRGVDRFFPVIQQRIREALGLFEQAVGRDPQFAAALAWAAVCQLRLHLDGWSEDPEAEMAKGVGFARRALQAAAHDPSATVNAVFALAYFGEEIGAMMTLIDNALGLNPSFARGWYVSGMVRLMAGELDEALEHAETAVRLSPRISVGGQYHTIGRANFFKRNFKEAISKLLVAVQEQPGSSDAFRFLAATYAHLGRLDEARRIVRQLRAITSVVVPSVTPYRNPEHRDLYLSGLRLATGEAA